MASLTEFRAGYTAGDYVELIARGGSPRVPDHLDAEVATILAARGLIRQNGNGHGTDGLNNGSAHKPAPLEVADGLQLLTIKSANTWVAEARTRPNPRRLFGDFWFEGELVFAFGDTGANKTTLAVQITDAISRGSNTLGLTCESPAVPVLYCDFELSDKQFEKRYSEDFTNHYEWSENFKRAEFNRDCVLPKGLDYEKALLNTLECEVKQNGYRVLVVDNVTVLKSKLQGAEDAIPFMQELNRLKKAYDLSILVLAHTPKTDPSRPITVNDLAGSKNLSNLADATFAVGKSQTVKGVRYLKQIKVRSADETYSTNNVLLSQLEKPSNFLSLNFISFGSEFEHLAVQAVDRVGDKTLAAMEFLKRELGDGSKAETEIDDAAKQKEITGGTLRIAKKKLNVVSKKVGYPGQWFWELPTEPEEANEGDNEGRRTPGKVAPSHLRLCHNDNLNNRNGLVEGANTLTPSQKDNKTPEGANTLTTEESLSPSDGEGLKTRACCAFCPTLGYIGDPCTKCGQIVTEVPELAARELK